MSDGSGLSAAKLPVKMSEFELIEETERAEDSHSAPGGPIFALNIRAFKMWETLRRMPNPVTAASSEESPTFITTVRLSRKTHLLPYFKPKQALQLTSS